MLRPAESVRICLYFYLSRAYLLKYATRHFISNGGKPYTRIAVVLLRILAAVAICPRAPVGIQ